MAARCAGARDGMSASCADEASQEIEIGTG
jgi:hypothetical protein